MDYKKTGCLNNPLKINSIGFSLDIFQLSNKND